LVPVDLAEAVSMKTYRVYVHPDKLVPVVIKDGFCWPAFIFGPLWFLANGMFLNFVLVALFAAAGHLFFAAKVSGALLPGALSALYIVVWILVGAFANWLLAAELLGEGYEMRGTVEATSLKKAAELADKKSDGE
jgi:hypothetical protein